MQMMDTHSVTGRVPSPPEDEVRPCQSLLQHAQYTLRAYCAGQSTRHATFDALCAFTDLALRVYCDTRQPQEQRAWAMQEALAVWAALRSLEDDHGAQ